MIINKLKTKVMLKTITFCAALASLAFCSCSNDRDGLSTTDGPAAIQFRTGISASTKGGPIVGVQFPDGSPLGFYAIQNTADGNPVWVAPEIRSAAKDTLFMKNIKGLADSKGQITYSPLKFYEDASYLYNFYGYYPFSNTDTVTPSAGVGPKLKCELLTTPSEQIDYLWATPLTNCTETVNAQDLIFNHAQTQVTFKIVNGMESDVRLDSLVFQATKGGMLDITDGKWSTKDQPMVSFPLFRSDRGITIKKGESYAVPEQLMLIPLAAGATPYTFNIGFGATPEKIFKAKELTLPKDGLLAGVSYEYTLTYGSSSAITLSARIVDWKQGPGQGIVIN